MIEVLHFNETFVKVRCDDSIAMELSEFFTFRTPKAQFHPLVKQRKWDGNIRLFNLKFKTLYKGLLTILCDFAETRGYPITVEDGLVCNNLVPEQDDLQQSLQKMFNPHDGKKNPLSYRGYQVRAIREALQKNRLTLLSPTSSGKSLLIYTLMRLFMQKKSIAGKKVLIVVPTTALVEQMTADFRDYSFKNGFDVAKSVHKIYDYDGVTLNTDKPVIVSTWQSLYRLKPEWFKQFGVVFVDEVHGAKADSLRTIMENLVDCKYRFGLTGTLDDVEMHELTIQGLFGDIVRVEHTWKMMERGEVAKLDIEMLFLRHPTTDSKALTALKKPLKKPLKPAQKYKAEMDFLCGHTKRNLFIKNLSLKFGKNILVLFQYVDKHGKILHDLIERDAKTGRKVFLVYGGTETEQREQIRHIVEEETDAIIIASYGTFSTGISIKNIHGIVFASPSKSKIRVLQSIGRGLRMSDTKDSVTLFDLVDDLSHAGDENYTLQHGMERIDIYSKERFNYRVTKLEI